MSSINWQPTNTQKEQLAAAPSLNSWTTGNPWFGVAMGLLGFIVGFILRTYVIAL